MKIFRRTFLLFWLTPLLLPGQTTVTLTCSKDCPIGYHTNANPGNINDVVPSVDQTGVNLVRTLVGFDLSQIPVNASLISAFLNLYSLHPIGNYPGHYGTANSALLQRITQNWGEYTATWVNQPVTTSVNEVTLAAATSYSQDYTNIDVTNLVRDMYNDPLASFGFMLRLAVENLTNILTFCSKDHASQNLHPTLVITYAINVGLKEDNENQTLDVWSENGSDVLKMRTPENVCAGEKVVLYSSGGAKISEFELGAEREQCFSQPGLTPGIYFLNYFSTDKNVIRKKFLVQE